MSFTNIPGGYVTPNGNVVMSDGGCGVITPNGNVIIHSAPVTTPSQSLGSSSSKKNPLPIK